MKFTSTLLTAVLVATSGVLAQDTSVTTSPIPSSILSTLSSPPLSSDRRPGPSFSLSSTTFSLPSASSSLAGPGASSTTTSVSTSISTSTAPPTSTSSGGTSSGASISGTNSQSSNLALPTSIPRGAQMLVMAGAAVQALLL